MYPLLLPKFVNPWKKFLENNNKHKPHFFEGAKLCVLSDIGIVWA